MIDRIRGFRGLLQVGTANIISSVIPGIFWFFMATILSSTEYGEVSYLLAIAAISSSVVMLGTGNTIVVYTSKESKIQNSIYLIPIISGSIGSIVLYFVFSSYSISVYVIAAVFFGLIISESLGLKNYKLYAKFVISQRLLMVIFSFSLYHIIGIEGIILGYGLSFIPYSILLYRSLQSNEFDFSQLREKSKVMMHSYAQNLSRTISLSADKIIIAPIFGYVLLANYQLSFQILLLMSIIPQSVFQYILPQDAVGKANKKLKIITVIVSILLTIFGIFVAPILVPYVFPAYEDIPEIIPIMSLGIVPITINLIYISKFFGNENTKMILFGAIVFLCIQIPLILVLGEEYDIMGTAIAFIVAHSAQCIFFVIGEKIISKNKSTV